MADETPAAAPAKPAEGDKPAAAPKRVKIACMTKEQIDKELKNVTSTMGGLGSRYARQLLKRQAALKG